MTSPFAAAICAQGDEEGGIREKEGDEGDLVCQWAKTYLHSRLSPPATLAHFYLPAYTTHHLVHAPGPQRGANGIRHGFGALNVAGTHILLLGRALQQLTLFAGGCWHGSVGRGGGSSLKGEDLCTRVRALARR